MIAMTPPRRLAETWKLPGRTAPAILSAFNRILQRHQERRAVLIGTRKLSGEALLSAIVLDFLDRPEAEQDAIVARNVPRFLELVTEGGEPESGEPRTAETTVHRDPGARTRRKSSG